MASYWIDLLASGGGAGTEFSPWNSTASLPALVAGDVVNIRGEGAVQYTLSGSGSAGAPITIRKDPSSQVKPLLHPVAQGAKVFTAVSRSHIRFEDFDVEAPPEWTSADTAAVFINGAGASNHIVRVRARRARFDFAGGFNRTDTLLDQCEATDCVSDGIRWFSGTGTYAWDGFRVIGGVYSRNGRGQGANGSGISLLIQNGHTASELKNVSIVGALVEDNFRYGVAVQDTSVAWPTLIAVGNTTPPNRQVKGAVVRGNTIRRNGDAGISLTAVQPSDVLHVGASGNLCEDNSARSTIGNIWTGGCLKPIISFNGCYRAYTNGTTVGDGQGIFDDQWNDGALVFGNEIADNVFQAFNPEYSAYGIGIFRCANSRHWANVIRGCRHGFYIGTVTGAAAPLMTNIQVDGNTVADFSQTAFVLVAATPAGALAIRNNLMLRGARDIEAQSASAGGQTFASNYAASVAQKYMGNGIGAAAVDHSLSEAQMLLSAGHRPLPGSPLIGAGLHLGYARDATGAMRWNPPTIGAYEYVRPRAAR